MLSYPDWGCGELGLKVAGGLNRPASGTTCDKRVLSGRRSFGKHLCFPLITLAGRKGECKRGFSGIPPSKCRYFSFAFSFLVLQLIRLPNTMTGYERTKRIRLIAKGTHKLTFQSLRSPDFLLLSKKNSMLWCRFQAYLIKC